MVIGREAGYTETPKSLCTKRLFTRPRFSVAIIGRTGCGNSARPGPWGCRRESAGTTRQNEKDKSVLLFFLSLIFLSKAPFPKRLSGPDKIMKPQEFKALH